MKEKRFADGFDKNITPAMRMHDITNTISNSPVSTRFKRVAALEKGHLTYVDSSCDLITIDFNLNLPGQLPTEWEGNPIEKLGSYLIYGAYDKINPLFRPSVGNIPEEVKKFHLVDKVFYGEKRVPARLKRHKNDKFIPLIEGKAFYVFDKKIPKTFIDHIDFNLPEKVIGKVDSALKCIENSLIKITQTEGMTLPYLNELKTLGSYFNVETVYRNKPK